MHSCTLTYNYTSIHAGSGGILRLQHPTISINLIKLFPKWFKPQQILLKLLKQPKKGTACSLHACMIVKWYFAGEDLFVCY